MKKILSSFTALLAIATTMLPVPIVNAGAKDSITKGINTTTNAANSGKDFNGVIDTVINTMLFIVGILSVAMIIYSGIRYVTAHGDKSQIESAKNTLIYSIVGLVIAIVAYAVVNWVLGLF